MSTAEQKKKNPIVWLKFILGPGEIRHQVIMEMMEVIKKEKQWEEHGESLNCLPLNKNVYLKADRIFLATDASPRLQYSIKNIFLNTRNILDILDKVDIVFEETTLEETLIYTLAYRANLNMSHFSFSLLMNTYEDEEKNIENTWRLMKISSMFIWETMPISAASNYTSPTSETTTLWNLYLQFNR